MAQNFRFNPTPDLKIKDQSVQGVVTDVYHENPGYDWKIFVIETESMERVKCLGEAPSLRIGMEVRCTGQFECHNRYGRQFNVGTFEMLVADDSLQGIHLFLSSGAIEGVNVGRANRIVSHFQDAESIKTAMSNPIELQKVDGIGPVSAEAIAASYQKMEHMVSFLSRCAEYGLHTKVAMRIYEEHTDNSLPILENRPYSLLSIPGVHWDIIDEIAIKHCNIDKDAPDRINAAIAHALHQSTWGTGDCFRFSDQFYDEVVALIKKPPMPADLSAATEAGVIVAVDIEMDGGDKEEVYYPYHLHYAEDNIATTLYNMINNSTPLPNPETLTSDRKDDLDPVQKEAVINALKHRVFYITGGPGTGKTFLEKIILDELSARNVRNPLLCAPTGRAAKQMEASTKFKASTIHRALGYDGESYVYGPGYPVEHKPVVVDETSMADVSLFHRLLSALPKDARLLMIGDVDQLPSVGPGNVLRDIIDSGVVPGVRLDKIYRQGRDSHIPQLSKAINEWQIESPIPEVPPFADGADIAFVDATQKDIDHEIRNLVQYQIPRMGFEHNDIQVLSPRRTGPGSIQSLNKVLRRALNPGDKRNDWGRFRPGDRVMQTKNAYGLGGYDVMNGDQGTVLRVSDDRKALIVSIEGISGEIRYTVADAKNLTHAYAITVHKSQGGQYPVVVMALLPEHGRLLYRSLLYTGITRAQNKLIIVGDRSAFAKAVRTEESNLRQTLLMERLQILAGTREGGL